MPPYAVQSRRIHREWLAAEQGEFAHARIEDLLGRLLADWPRRSRSLLVMNAGGGRMLESLWQAGFDVTGQENDQACLTMPRTNAGRRVDVFISAPDHMPYDDCSFDYALGIPGYWENPEATLVELRRVVCSGVALLFPNVYSLCGIGCLFGRRHPLFQHPDCALLSPRTLWHLTRKVFGKRTTAWSAVLVGPALTWTPASRLAFLNRSPLPAPLGAIAGLRVDFGPLRTGTPLLLRAAEPVPTR